MWKVQREYVGIELNNKWRDGGQIEWDIGRFSFKEWQENEVNTNRVDGEIVEIG